MPQIKQIDVAAIFTKQTGRPLPVKTSGAQHFPVAKKRGEKYNTK